MIVFVFILFGYQYSHTFSVNDSSTSS